MAIKLFVKEHISYIIFQIFLTLFLLALFWLDGFRNVNTAIYAVVVTVLLISSFLLVRYMLRRRYLKRIVKLPTAIDDALQKTAKTPEYFMTEDYLHA